jgi:hypothetical protein
MDLYFSQHLGSRDDIYRDIKFSRADRQPCLVCGHPTGDCSTDTSNPTHVIGFDVAGKDNTPLIFLEEDVWEERAITPYTRARVLVYKKGQSIGHDEAKRLGLI